MVWHIPVTTVQANTVVPLAADDDLFVASNVLISSTGGNASAVTGTTGHTIDVRGTILNSTSGPTIRLLDAPGVASNSLITVGPNGEIGSLASGAAIAVHGHGAQIFNEGRIFAKSGLGIALLGADPNATARIENSGLIESRREAIIRDAPSSSETIVLINSGTIKGVDGSFGFEDHSTSGRNLITNAGTMIGDIRGDKGNDVYAGATGRFTGKFFGREGDDTAIGGIDNEWFEGNDGSDTLSGNAGNDQLFGQAGQDRLSGGVGPDTLQGGADKDILTGGGGKDTLTGGTERDLFDFDLVSESVVGTNRDVITDFVRGTNVTGDDIDLSGIDARTGVAGNQAFTFIGTATFTNVKGQLRFADQGAICLVQADVTGDGKADFEISVKAPTLMAGDFIL